MTRTDQLTETLQRNLEQRIKAPDFPRHVDWLNVEQPLTMGALRGKVVLLDFWTFCCINCMHVIPELKRLEAAYPNELVVIGVHSAKFQNEKVTDEIRQSVLRYEVMHPVLNDATSVLWTAYGVNAWPTLILIDPEGHVVLHTSGEGNGPLLDTAIQWLIRHHEGRGTLNRSPIAVRPETTGSLTSSLRFPGKVVVAQQEVFIADSNHHQIVIADLEGRIRQRIGRGTMGLQDGGFEDAEFNHPQGLARDGERLYVADTENHLIREASLAKKTVRTIAGTGHQGHVLRDQAPAKATALNSPWDLVVIDGVLYIAMAGAHQIWSLDVKNGMLARYAGTGQEQLVDGPLSHCALAQPSGINADPAGNLYLADSEVSAVRRIDRQAARLETLIGSGLFTFGDRDGPWKDARLQHPLGILWHDGALYLADSYNHKIKRLNLSERTIETLAGTGKAGLVDGSPGQLAEPAGLSVSNGTLYVADTNNHAIRLLTLTPSTLSTLQLHDASLPAPPPTPLAGGQARRKERRLLNHAYSLPTRQVSAGPVLLTINVSLPQRTHLAEGAPLDLSITSSSGRTTIPAPNKRLLDPAQELPVEVSFTPPADGAEELTITTTVFYCPDAPPGLCRSRTVVVRQPLEISRHGASHLDVSIPLLPTPEA
jgi:thiol-disulfide isomerase/thioredoxin/sugar lactone lactonase YvrE